MKIEEFIFILIIIIIIIELLFLKTKYIIVSAQKLIQPPIREGSNMDNDRILNESTDTLCYEDRRRQNKYLEEFHHNNNNKL